MNGINKSEIIEIIIFFNEPKQFYHNVVLRMRSWASLETNPGALDLLFERIYAASNNISDLCFLSYNQEVYDVK